MPIRAIQAMKGPRGQLGFYVVPFIGPGEVVRVDLRTGRYVERARAERKRSA